MHHSEPAPTIVVVDDNRENLALARATLEDEGYTVLCAERGELGLELVEKHNPDCVLLDVRMPGMDGFAVCAKIRQMPGSADVPVVFLTALRDLDTFDRALRAGGDDFLSKPVRPTELLVRVQAALKLRRMSAELRDQVDLIRHQRDDLLRLQLQKERLSAFVVHDLKNPVNAMDLHAQLLLRTVALPDNARESVLRIRDQARALLRLIYNLLDISKAEEGRLAPHVTELDLAALGVELMDAFAIKASENNVTLNTQLAATHVRADADLLRRVLENLLDNAVRHAPRNSAVVLSSKAVLEGVELRVTDQGPGLSDAVTQRVFERFVQLGPTQADGSQGAPDSRAGRGLGLAFCKLAVEAHGGSIRVENTNPGAAFVVLLPHEQPPSTTVSAAALLHDPSAKAPSDHDQQ
jgi:signal transduction histidine kinase